MARKFAAPLKLRARKTRKSRRENWKPTLIRSARRLKHAVSSRCAKAVETFLGDQKARGLSKDTQKKYRGFLERQFLVWADSRKIKFLARVSPAELTKFRASWSNGETTTHRKHEMLASFFRFCQRNELIGKIPWMRSRNPRRPTWCLPIISFPRNSERSSAPPTNMSSAEAMTANSAVCVCAPFPCSCAGPDCLFWTRRN